MKIEIVQERGKKMVKFLGKINMNQEMILSNEDAKRLSKALAIQESTSFETA